VTGETGGSTEAAAAVEASPTGAHDSASSSQTPAAPILPLRQTGRYTVRFALIYGGLGAVLIAAVSGLVVLLAGTSIGNTFNGSWSNWAPPRGTTSNVTSSIAQHVAQQYHLNKAGSELLAVVSGPPQLANGTHKVEMSHIAVRRTANSATGIQVFPTGSTWTEQLCGLGTACSITSGQASYTRGRLVRREALEVALYTFKFVPAINSVVAFMPPPPGQTTTELLYLQRADLLKQLSQPLDQTLPLATPPLPNAADPKEAATIDKLTLPSIYSYTVQGLQDNSALLILDPVKT
jgi:hypothetical protein